jgi:ABC-type dipeptide/oligopeptide/nickel transport system permease component
MGATLLFALIYLAASLVVDLAYALFDPRVRLVGR